MEENQGLRPKQHRRTCEIEKEIAIFVNRFIYITKHRKEILYLFVCMDPSVCTINMISPAGLKCAASLDRNRGDLAWLLRHGFFSSIPEENFSLIPEENGFDQSRLVFYYNGHRIITGDSMNSMGVSKNTSMIEIECRIE